MTILSASPETGDLIILDFITFFSLPKDNFVFQITSLKFQELLLQLVSKKKVYKRNYSMSMTAVKFNTFCLFPPRSQSKTGKTVRTKTPLPPLPTLKHYFLWNYILIRVWIDTFTGEFGNIYQNFKYKYPFKWNITSANLSCYYMYT